MLVLQGGGEAQAGTQPIIVAYSHVSEGSAAWDKLPTHFLVPVVELQTISPTEPVVGPSLCALSLATYPTAQQLTLVRVAVEVSVVKVEKTMAQSATGRQVRVHTLDAQVESWQTW